MNIEQRINEELDTLLRQHSAEMRRCLHFCESPMERLFLLAFWGVCGSGRDDLDEMAAWQRYRVAGKPLLMCGALRGYGPASIMVQQYEVGRYRLDFAILPIDGDGPRLAIEIDGHAYHERTKLQAQRDKSRDRWLATQGWTVLRFTGSEVYRRADDLIGEILDCFIARSQQRAV